MPKNYYTCKQCNIVYVSYKPKSDYCSIECKRLANPKPTYKCDYCGKEYKISKNQLNRLESGKQKHSYCSKECLAKSQNKQVIKICEWCNKEFTISLAFADKQRYCSRQCYLDYGNRPNYCKACGEPFKSSHRDALYCCKECQISDLYPKIECECKTCGKIVSYSPKEYFSKKDHYCSQKCHFDDIAWSDSDKEILFQHYGVKDNFEISEMLSKKYTVRAIKSAASRYGIKAKQRWSDEEKQYLIAHYENTPFSIIQKHLPNRSKISIVGQAHQYGLKSFGFYESRWTEEEEQYLREHYSCVKTSKIAEKLNRNANSIVQHANIMGLEKNAQIGECYKKLSQYIRSQNSAFHLRKLKENDFVCQITGVRGNVALHHIYGFNLILEEALEILNIEPKENFCEYTIKELTDIYELFAELQDNYNKTICISKEVHVKFHNEYGYGNNTPKQWEEFINKYYNN